ncbi:MULTISPECIES: hypothetical protein [Shewanella]|uniref:hypothetical protein n=1 Tax=Shewanella TaxID=22 RepID=UPI000CB5813B|nr:MULTISPECIES: hypothetical protein [Shewanella]PIW62766.1 MAG: hypothetical protein COW15_01780 [Shewanella sp. CG12_big_fil_rev_8_21_14_0_65_47_15]
MNKAVKKMLAKHERLVHSEGVTVLSHTQREKGEWIQHTIMVDDCDVPFKFRRVKKYKDLQGQKVSLVYYPDTEMVAGFEIEIMQVVRIKRF